MRTYVIFGGLAGAGLILMWFFWAAQLSLLLDRLGTVRMAELPSNPIGLDDTNLQVGDGEPGRLGPAGWVGADILIGAHMLRLAGPKDVAAAKLMVDAEHRLVLVKDSQSFVFGREAGTLRSSEGTIPAFAADPGDQASVTVEHGLSWPTPFELNFMTGNSPSWRRHIYYRLRWRKASGAELKMAWRYVQGYDSQNDWRRAPESREGETGLIQVEIAQTS